MVCVYAHCGKWEAYILVRPLPIHPTHGSIMWTACIQYPDKFVLPSLAQNLQHLLTSLA